MSALSNTVMHWLNSHRLRKCSAPAFRLWMMLLPLMHASDRKGYLQDDGDPLSAVDISHLTDFCGADEVTRLLQELTAVGVACVTDNGTIYCKVLVGEVQKLKIRNTANGRNGGRPPAAANPVVSESEPTRNPLVTDSVTSGLSAPETPENLPVSSTPPEKRTGARVLELSSLSSSEKEKKDQYQLQKGGGAGGGRKKRNDLPPIPASLDTPRFREAWERWLQHRREKRATLKFTTAESQLRAFAAWGDARAVAAIEHTIFRGWTGIREDESARPNLFTSLTESIDGPAPGKLLNFGAPKT